MPIRRINSTGRKKLLREDTRIVLTQHGNGMSSFDAMLNLADYELPANANVFVEAYRQSTFMRFPYGTVQSPLASNDISRTLTEFPTRDGVLFRVKVVSAGEGCGLLLAEGDQIPPTSTEDREDRRIPLLPTAPADLGQEVWCVEIGASGPLLQVNRHLQDWKAVAGSPVFRSLTYPSAMREILRQILLVDEVFDADDESSWRGRWLRFACSLGAGEPPEQDTEESEKAEWIDAAAKRFAHQHQILNYYKAHLDSEEAQ